MLGVTFGICFIAFKVGISVAAGAFFAGVLIAESKVHAVTKVLATPIRDMFAALFFVSVGSFNEYHFTSCIHSARVSPGWNLHIFKIHNGIPCIKVSRHLALLRL
jgi:predicted Kef-type K+ transport protein